MELEIIPFAERYEISSYGDIWDDYGNKLKASTSTDGYLSTTLYLNDGRYKNYRINRLVLASFIDDEPFFDPKMHSNHRDHDILNNHYSNLEWLSPRMNNVHHALFTRSGSRIKLVANHRDGRELCFNNIMDASDDLDIDQLEIWDCVKLNVRYHGWTFRHRGFSGRVPESIRRPNRQELSRRPVIVKDISNGNVREFSSLSEVGRYLDVGISSVKSAMVGVKPRLLLNRYQVVNKGETFPLIDSDRIRDLLERSGKEVFVLITKNQRVIYYPSAKDFYTDQNLSKKRVTTLLARREVVEIEGMVFCYSSNDVLVSRLKRAYGCPET